MTSSNSQNINNDYIDWKAWNNHNFGQLKSQDRRYFNAELRYITRNQPNTACVLEIGFGNGKFLQYSLDAGWTIVGTEINPLLVKIAQEAGFNALCSGNLSELSANQFDMVVAFDVLEHIPQDQILFFLKEIKRVLKPKGFCLLRFPNGDSPFGLSNQNGDITHVSSIGSKKIQYFASQTPLKLICCRGECEPILESNIMNTLRRGLSVVVKKIISFFIDLIFYHNRNFCSDNLVAILQKTDLK